MTGTVFHEIPYEKSFNCIPCSKSVVENPTYWIYASDVLENEIQTYYQSHV